MFDANRRHACFSHIFSLRLRLLGTAAESVVCMYAQLNVFNWVLENIGAEITMTLWLQFS